ncbi:hypothetical protein NDI85_06155 [Halomicroarcula sp. S1AR25-4]|uniref:hypothetical protein n=1 Tax=Haloarcula sp. S1AR25-4 TaxID=2950538 RepID=UPI0028741C80|nr:hypothetical protein [Halomicroarcula sp. S1AR25-4]MDS0277369.1 hypothetical protein [Halomicroarcula sp. S1AR25-4]
MAEKLGDPNIVHEEGSFDEFLLIFYWDYGDGQRIKWSPKNEEIFQMLEMWFRSEDEGYEGGYGSMWQLFFIALTRLEGRNAALENNQLTGWDAKEHFLKQVATHGDEVVAEMEEMVEEAKREYEG